MTFMMCAIVCTGLLPRSQPVPQQVDLREWSGPIKDQGEEGSCTGHAFSSAREWIARKYEKPRRP